MHQVHLKVIHFMNSSFENSLKNIVNRNSIFLQCKHRTLVYILKYNTIAYSNKNTKRKRKSIVKVQSPVSIPPQQAKNQTRPMEKLCSNKNDLKFETF